MRIARLGPWRPVSGWQRLVERGLRAVLAETSADLDPIYEQVTYWWLEVNDGGQVTREIGFEQSGQAIAAAPLGTNPGIFTELEHAPDGLGEPVSAAAFERVWSEVAVSVEHRHR
jgi:hypothetical protein